MSITGTLILSFFATAWWVVGLRAAGHGPALVYPVPLLAVALGCALWYLARPAAAPGVPDEAEAAEEARRGRLVGWASAGEGVAILVATNVLSNTGHRDAVAPAIAIVVGAHFVPLARGLPAPAYHATAAALVALGVAGLAVADVPTRLTLVSAGAAVVLWLTALSALRHALAARGAGTHAGAHAGTPAPAAEA